MKIIICVFFHFLLRKICCRFQNLSFNLLEQTNLYAKLSLSALGNNNRSYRIFIDRHFMLFAREYRSFICKDAGYAADYVFVNITETGREKNAMRLINKYPCCLLYKT